MKSGTLIAALAAATIGGTALGQIGEAYIFNMRGTRSLFTIPPATGTPRTFINANLGTTFLSYGMDFSADATTLYALNTTVATAVTLGTFDLATGVFSLIAPVTGAQPVAPVDLCIGPDNTAYYIGGTGDSNIYTISLITGVCTLVAPLGVVAGQLIVDVAIDVNGQMYGHDIGTDTLVTIDKTNGTVATVGPHGLLANFAQGMDFDWSNNTLYAPIYTGGGTGQWVSWNITTGAVTQIFVTTPWNAEMEVSIRQPAPSGPGCDSDFNCDGNSDQDDVACIINVVAGNPGCECQDPDFNGDGNVDQDDVAALIGVVAGSPCP